MDIPASGNCPMIALREYVNKNWEFYKKWALSSLVEKVLDSEGG
jgi:hypothetical protein